MQSTTHNTQIQEHTWAYLGVELQLNNPQVNALLQKACQTQCKTHRNAKKNHNSFLTTSLRTCTMTQVLIFKKL